MYIYGGYQDLRGSTAELWAFHFPSETWHLVSQGGNLDGPPARHRYNTIYNWRLNNGFLDVSFFGSNGYHHSFN